jgi:hypothetical protein
LENLKISFQNISCKKAAADATKIKEKKAKATMFSVRAVNKSKTQKVSKHESAN